MNGVAEVLNWSLRLGRFAGVEVRVSWMLGIWVLFDAVMFAQAHLLVMIPFAFVVPPLTMALHAIGHLLGARWAGGRLSGTTLSVLNNQDDIQVPLRRWSHLLAGLGGIAVNLLVALGCWFGSEQMDGLGQAILGYVARTNLYIVIFNLLACQPFDGHRWWRALLWFFLPMGRAVDVAVKLGFISAILLVLGGVWFLNAFLLFMGICSFIMTVYDRQAIAAGSDPVLWVDPDDARYNRRSDRAERKAAKAAARADKEAAAEQEVLDRLLAKVSANGLPSLTKGEYKELQRISQRQKERDGGG